MSTNFNHAQSFWSYLLKLLTFAWTNLYSKHLVRLSKPTGISDLSKLSILDLDFTEPYALIISFSISSRPSKQVLVLTSIVMFPNIILNVSHAPPYLRSTQLPRDFNAIGTLVKSSNHYSISDFWNVSSLGCTSIAITSASCNCL